MAGHVATVVANARAYEEERRRAESLAELDRAKMAEAVVVAMTGYGQPEDRRRSELAGFDGHLVKPVDPAAIEELLSSLASRA